MDLDIRVEDKNWHDELIRDQKAGRISPFEGSVKTIKKLSDWFGALTHEKFLSGVSFTNEALEFNSMKPYLYQIVLNNKVIEMINRFDVENRDEIQQTIQAHYDDMLDLFTHEYPVQCRYEWTYGVNPKLSTLYRKLNNRQ